MPKISFARFTQFISPGPSSYNDSTAKTPLYQPHSPNPIRLRPRRHLYNHLSLFRCQHEQQNSSDESLNKSTSSMPGHHHHSHHYQSASASASRAKSFDAVLFDVLRVTPEEFAVSALCYFIATCRI